MKDAIYIVVNEDKIGAIEVVWSAHEGIVGAIEKADEHLICVDSQMMAVVRLVPGEEPEVVWDSSQYDLPSERDKREKRKAMLLGGVDG